MSGWRVFSNPISPQRLWLVVALCVLGLASTRCDDAQAPPANGTAAYRGQFDAGHGEMELQLAGPQGDLSPLRLVVTDLSVDATNHRVHAMVGIRNVGNAAVTGPAGIEVEAFVPGDVMPVNAACRVCVTTPCPTSCVFDHRGTYGDDGVLAANETSTAVEWIFNNPSNESFSFHARIVVEPGSGDGLVSGVVFADANGDGHRDRDETGLEGAPITLEGESGPQIARTGADGRYAFQVDAPGLYELIFGCPGCASAPPYPCVLTTPERRQVLVVRRADGTLSSFVHGDFGCARPFTETLATGVVFDDLDRDGVRDRGEPGVPGVRIVAQSVHCDIAARVTETDAQGRYRIPLPGCLPWTVEHDALPGFVDTTPNPVTLPRERRDPGDPMPPQPAPYLVDFGVSRGPF